MSGNVIPIRRAPPAPAPLTCLGLGSYADNKAAVTVCFSRPLTDDELHFFHEACQRSAPLMDGITL